MIYTEKKEKANQAWVMVKIRPTGSLPLNFNSFPLPSPLIR